MNQGKKPDIFHYPLMELDITGSDLAPVMGYEDPTMLPDQILEALPELIKIIASEGSITCAWISYDPIEIDHEKKRISCNQQWFETGKVVTHQLRRSEKAVWFICTAGEHLTRLAKRLYQEDDGIRGYTIDVLLNLVIEKTLDRFQENLLAEVSKEGMQITNRYSPGYCEWDVSEQRKLFNLFPEGILGVTLSSSSMMIPVKSVSGIIGVGREVTYNAYTCALCNDTNCLYRNTRARTRKTPS
ncbi:vitamin B12 dependent-methionine synthase activation domain-containing protein [Bacteroidota bacterium]